MRFAWKIVAALALVFLPLALPAAADPLRTAHVESELVSSRAVIAPGERFTIALRQRVVEGWHTYWTNPGDSGEPTRLTWTLPQGFTAGEMRHPAPDTELLEVVMTYVHRGEIFYPIEITAPRTLRPGQTVTLRAHAFYLVCSNICVTEEGDVELTLPVFTESQLDGTWAPRIDAAIAALPRTADDVEARITAGEPARLTIAGAPLANMEAVRDLTFFPHSQDALRHVAPQDPSFGANGVSFALTPGIDGPLGERDLIGVLSFEQRVTEGWERRALEILATPGEPLPRTSGGAPEDGTASADTPGAPAESSLLLQLLFALLGGLILNIMPCVLPVLAIKAVGLAQGAHDGRARRDGLFYLAGVVTTFLALATLIIALRSAGEALGWAFQLQEPWLVALLALLFYAIGLNFLGAYEIAGAGGMGETLASKSGDAGAFFTGVLAVVAASPCTGPFMAGAVGFALASPPAVTLVIFTALAIGFAAPILALSFAPALQRLVPKPGAWMIRFRQVLAFAMFGAAAWLAWVLTVQTGAAGTLALLSIAVAFGFVILTLRWGRLWVTAALALLAAVVLVFWGPLTTPAAQADAAAERGALRFEPWSPERVRQAQAEGRPVFVNFTAAWCVQCQVNELLTLRSARVAQAFEGANVLYLKADWTNRNDAIANELARHGMAGIPLYLYYAPGARAPAILPPTLSEADILNAVGGDQ